MMADKANSTSEVLLNSGWPAVFTYVISIMDALRPHIFQASCSHILVRALEPYFELLQVSCVYLYISLRQTTSLGFGNDARFNSTL
jgi:hypothetical protein